MIKAGNPDEFSRDPKDWIFLDIGFSSKSKSNGVMIFDGQAENVSWAQAIRKIRQAIMNKEGEVNLMIEAPLSVSFNKEGNPVGRSFEKLGSRTRYWYLQGGAVTLLSAGYLIAQLKDTNISVNLFEAFVSFKSQATDHVADALLMRKGIVTGKTPLCESAIKNETENN